MIISDYAEHAIRNTTEKIIIGKEEKRIICKQLNFEVL
jgi:hypothetical protein